MKKGTLFAPQTKNNLRLPMKHIYTITLFFFSIIALANNPFELKNEEIDFSHLEKIEQVVNQNPDISLSTLEKESPELLENLAFDSDLTSTAFLTDNDTLIPPFWWGFCLGIWGVIIVLIMTDKDKDAVNTAFKGCIAMGLTVLAVYGIIVLISLTAAASI